MVSSKQRLSPSSPQFVFDTNEFIEDKNLFFQQLSENMSWHIKIALGTSASPLCGDGVVQLERDRMLIRRAARYGYKFDQISGVYQLFDSTFNLRLFTLIDLTLNRRVFSVLDVPVVRDILIGRWIAKWSQALGMASGRRSVYLMATRLDRFASIFGGTGAADSIITGLGVQILQSPFRMNSINHWALLIMGDDGLEEASLLCQLRVSTGGYIEYDVMEDYTLAQSIMENGRHIGFTMCSNEAIKEQARQVLNSMPNTYNVANNNCQTFCNRLFECIRQTTTTTDLLSGRRELPREVSSTIAKRRTIELVSSMITPKPKRNKAMVACTNAAPSSLNTAVLAIIDILSVMVLYWSFWQLSTWLYCLVAVTLALQGYHGNSGLFRRRRGLRMQDEGLKVLVDEEIKWAIDYLVPFVLFHSTAGSQ